MVVRRGSTGFEVRAKSKDMEFDMGIGYLGNARDLIEFYWVLRHIPNSIFV